MHYLVELDNSEAHHVQLEEDERGVWRATIDEEDREVDLELRGRDEDGAYVVLVDGEERRFHLEQDAANSYLTDDRAMLNVDVEQAGDVVIEEGETERRGKLDLGTVDSPITGVALEVLVDEGDTVVEGDPVMIVEAMKMENTISAPVDGIVETVDVDQGERVFTGDQLLHIERHADQ